MTLMNRMPSMNNAIVLQTATLYGAFKAYQCLCIRCYSKLYLKLFLEYFPSKEFYANKCLSSQHVFNTKIGVFRKHHLREY